MGLEISGDVDEGYGLIADEFRRNFEGLLLTDRSPRDRTAHRTHELAVS